VLSAMRSGAAKSAGLLNFRHMMVGLAAV